MRTPAVFVAGLPGCGKTTLCLAAQRRFGLHLVRYCDLLSRPEEADLNFAELFERAAPSFPNTATIFDSLPKGIDQAYQMFDYVSPQLLIIVSSDPASAKRRAQRRSPSRFSNELINSKFALRVRQTSELEAFCRDKFVPIKTVANNQTETDFLSLGLRIIEEHLPVRN